MTKRNAILLGCGTPILIGAVLFGLVVRWVVHVAQDVEGVAVTIDSPLDVKLGETFPMTVNVKNERDHRVLSVSDIDIGSEYLEGFVMVATEPPAKSSMILPLDHSMSYTFDTPIPAGETKAFVFTLRAEKAGLFRGDVDVCEGQRFITTIAQTVVRD